MFKLLKVLGRKLGVLVVSTVLGWVVLLGNPLSATADKAPQSMMFDATTDGVTIAAIYETTPDTQKEIVSSVLKSSKSFFKKAPGFSSFSVLQSEDGTRVIALTQWQDAASYEASLTQSTEDYAAKYSKKEKSKDKVTAEPTKTIMFKVEQTLAPPGMKAAIRGKNALVQFSEITANSPDDITTLLTAAEEQLPHITEMYPAPRSAVLLKSVDSADLAMLASWGYVEEFDDLTLVPTLAVLPDDVSTLTANDEHLYEVMKIIAAKPEKSEAKDD
ncbi:antibiotic biosynthesis monooxygenase [Thermocoleostomius sinensis]|uniref:Antibiotic biosynthesis monooxygenase n=1 Tax=Thermocoleostomius sinensis A174 TaxID=2016057 RepID=A0A9E8ZIT3_9CYAN|nr:antibiotic biosynthesis monooxygenase [Thermocoleostomius sinensis]WAL62025.1 antibiotic biosynthesis monooxygenase [Thermocoleostomius sinensis A174]